MKQVEMATIESLANVLATVTDLWQHRHELLFKRHGITSNQFKVLRAVAANNRQHATNQQSIADTTGINKMVVSQTLDTLHKKLLLTRIKDPIDKRQYTVRLGNSGRGLLEKVTPELIELNRDFLSKLEVNERAELIGLLDKLVISSWI